MNSQKVKGILKAYKRHFNNIHNEEIYKWRAVKCFQDNWNIQALDFSSIVRNSFALAKNLLDSGLYYPKRMLTQYAEIEPETLRQLFIELYNEELDLINRIATFQNKINELHKRHFPYKNDYQDDRAVLVYLCLRYPERYYLYKFKMLKAFVQLVDYPYQPQKGDVQNILEYLSLCDLIKAEIVKDKELIELHKTRIKKHEYNDDSYNILTQDVIYAAVKHIDQFDQNQTQESALKRLTKIEGLISPGMDNVSLKGSFVNFIENARENKRIGDLGELLVMQYEHEKLMSFGIEKVPEHKSKSEGDGIGYDILSYDDEGNEIFIEVKTTVGDSSTPFYVTRNELIRSIKDINKFYLYRLYEFNDVDNSAKYHKRKGDLTELCTNPILYKAVVDQ